MPTTVGVLIERQEEADALWNQCDGGFGAHAGFRLVGQDTSADRVLCFGTPIPAGGVTLAPGSRLRARVRGRSRSDLTLEAAWRGLGRDPTGVDVIFYEPPPVVADAAYELARRHARRVFGPDPRATHRLRLPSLWTIGAPLGVLRDAPAPEGERLHESKPVALACVTSGKRMIPGHAERLGFLKCLREAGVGMELFGRGVEASLGGRGSVASKAHAMWPARCTLAIENHAEGDEYVTEKLWDALACWSLPLYYGSRAPDAMIPPESFIRLPDLGEAGVEAVRAAVGDESAYLARLPAIGEARRRMFGELRMTEWIRREVLAVGGGSGDA
ncbi:MAG: hypothetical protein EA378_09185 [Phycisphaerales bacterium]|nr:MAG: hypothetical protein EA378_09185 [Phycisphaerales bacterium]